MTINQTPENTPENKIKCKILRVLIKKIISGTLSNIEFREFYNSYKPQIANKIKDFTKHMGADRYFWEEKTIDIVNNVFIAIYKGSPFKKFRLSGEDEADAKNLHNYILKTLTQRQIYKIINRKKNRKELEVKRNAVNLSREYDKFDADWDGDDTPKSYGGTAETSLIREREREAYNEKIELINQVLEKIRQLNNNMSEAVECFKLKFMENLKTREISEMKGISESLINTRNNRIMDILRSTLNPAYRQAN
ncbi:MAG: hypothetical protein IKO42_00660 [Opitutales bacterium]|nr:hypothetical protein [Opitutales bacterium]